MATSAKQKAQWDAGTAREDARTPYSPLRYLPSSFAVADKLMESLEKPLIGR